MLHDCHALAVVVAGGMDEPVLDKLEDREGDSAAINLDTGSICIFTWMLAVACDGCVSLLVKFCLFVLVCECVYVCLSLLVSVCQSVCACVCLCLCLSVSACLCVCLCSLYLYLNLAKLDC